ncbi:MAG: hypothetical protein IKS48_09505 [Eubacterium sp.]|nr:hypothetical protein [Eubacterium sp.]
MNILDFAKGKNMQGYQLGFLTTVFLVGFMGIVVLPFYIYLFGAGIFWEYLGVFICMIILWNVQAFRLMRYSRTSEGIISLPGFFSVRFDEKTGFIRVLSSSEIIVISLVVAGLLIKEMNLILSRVFGKDVDAYVFIILMITALHIGKFGMEILARTAVIKAVLFFTTILGIGIFMYFDVGIYQLIRNMMQTNITGSVSEYLNIMFHSGRLLTVNDIISLASVGLLASGMPFLLACFFTVTEAESISTGKKVMLVYSLLLFLTCAMVGGISRGYLYEQKLTDSLSVYIYYLYRRLAEGGFCGGMLGNIYLVSMIFAILTGIEGTISVVTTVIFEDILKKGRLVRIKKRQEEWVLLTVSILAGVSIYILSRCIRFISVDMILVFLSTLGCSISPTVFMALVWKRMNRYGCVAGLMTGLLGVPVFKYVQLFDVSGIKVSLCEVLGLNTIVPSMIISVIMIIVVSLLTKKESKKIEDQFVEVRNRLVD